MLYNGKNPALKDKLSPLETRIEVSIRRILGSRFSELAQKSEQLLLPNSYVELEASTPAEYEPGDAAAKASEVIYDQVKEGNLKLFQASIELYVMEEVIADEFAKRVLAYSSIGRSDFFQRPGTGENGIGASIARLSDLDFSHAIANWPALIKTWLSYDPDIFRAYKTLTSIPVSKQPLTEGSFEGEAVSFTTMTDMAFILRFPDYQSVRMVNGEFSNGNGTGIISNPGFRIPLNYSPKAAFGMNSSRPELFEVAAYMHEFGHFAQYALAAFPITLTHSLFNFGAQGRLAKT